MTACPSVRISTAHDPLKGQHRRNNPMKHCTYSSSCSSLMSPSVQPFYPQSTVIQHKDPEKLKSLADKCWKYEIAKSCCVNYIMLSIYQVKRKLNFSCSYEINIWCTMQTWSNNQKSLSNPPQIFAETRKKTLERLYDDIIAMSVYISTFCIQYKLCHYVEVTGGHLHLEILKVQ